MLNEFKELRNERSPRATIRDPVKIASTSRDAPRLNTSDHYESAFLSVALTTYSVVPSVSSDLTASYSRLRAPIFVSCPQPTTFLPLPISSNVIAPGVNQLFTPRTLPVPMPVQPVAFAAD